MGKTAIEWATDVWNPVTGCTKVSQGCKNCYAKALHDMRHTAYQAGKTLPAQYAVPFETVQLHYDRLSLPRHWKRPRRIFVNSMSDLFHEDVPDEFIWHVFKAMSQAPQHIFMVLTKRAGRMPDVVNKIRSMLPDRLEHVWLGVSVEDQAAADERIPFLLQTRAAVRFLSCEPLLGPVNLRAFMRPSPGWTRDIDWVIVGGESGPGARPMHPDWARSLRDQCQAAGTALFFKQWGEWAPPEIDRYGPSEVAPMDGSCTARHHCFAFADGQRMERVGKHLAGRLLDGRTWDQIPGEVQP